MNNYAKIVLKITQTKKGTNMMPEKHTYQKSTGIKDLINTLFGILIFSLAVTFIIFSDKVSSLSKTGVGIAIYSVLPSTFPYLIFSNLLIFSSFFEKTSKRLSFLSHFFKISPSSVFILLIAIFSGFPVPSAAAFALYDNGTIDKNELSGIAAFCSFCGPPFIISFFGKNIMGDINAGIVCFLVQLVLCFTFGRLLALKSNIPIINPQISDTKNKKEDAPAFVLICNSIQRGGASFCGIAFFVIFFFIFSGIVKELILLLFPETPEIFMSMISGFLELSSGIASLSSSDFSLKIKFVLGCTYIYWAGASVLFQISATMMGKISMKKYLAGKLFLLLLGVPISYFIYFFILS